MKHVVYRLIADYEKEENWLNDMARRGLCLIDFAWGRYLFEEGRPGEYVYRIELLKKHYRHVESTAYIKFMEELGIECVAGNKRWAYFRRKSNGEPFDLFSDFDSRIDHYNRVLAFVTVAFAVNLVIAILNIIIAIVTRRVIFDSINFYSGSISLIVALIFAPLCFSYRGKVKRLKDDRQLRE